MATETATPTKSPGLTSLTEAFRKAADPDNSTGRNPAPKVDTTISITKDSVEPVKEPSKEPVKQPEVKEVPTKGDPDAGLKTKGKDREQSLRELAEARDEAIKRAADLEARLKETEGRIPLDYDQIKTEREQLMTALERTNIEESPKFKEKYDKPQASILSQIKKTLSTTEANADEIAALVGMPESRERTKALADAIESLDRISQGKIATQITQFDQLRDARASELASPRETFQQMRQEQEKQSKAQKEQSAKTIESVIARAKEGMPWFKEIDGNEAWNAKVKEIETQARSFWNDRHTPENLAEVTFAGAMAPLFKRGMELAQAENEKLNAELAQYRETNPKLAANGEKSGNETGKKETVVEAFRRAAGVPERRR